MKRVVVYTLAVMMVSSWMANGVVAQTTAGAKARGHYERGFGNLGERTMYRPAYELRNTQPAATYRSFSYEPPAFRVGDKAVAAGDVTKVMRGSEVVGTVPKGTAFTVTKVVNGWLGTVIEIEGKQVNGWIWHRGVTSETATLTAQPQAAQAYRSFSYEPATSGYQARQSRTREPWLYPKTDPRRYEH